LVIVIREGFVKGALTDLDLNPGGSNTVALDDAVHQKFFPSNEGILFIH
jgi:hypothetical protein